MVGLTGGDVLMGEAPNNGHFIRMFGGTRIGAGTPGYGDHDYCGSGMGDMMSDHIDGAGDDYMFNYRRGSGYGLVDGSGYGCGGLYDDADGSGCGRPGLGVCRGWASG